MRGGADVVGDRMWDIANCQFRRKIDLLSRRRMRRRRTTATRTVYLT